MGLSALAKKPASGARVNKVTAAIGRMSSDQKSSFKTVIVNPSEYASADIARAMQADGFEISAPQIVHYRTLLREGKVSL